MRYFAGLLAGLLVGAASAGAAGRPNIVLIVSDDAGYGDIGFSDDAADTVPTPAIDLIAQAGVRFTDGYVTASVCSPSRAGLLSGRYQQRFGHEFNLGESHERAGLGMPGEVETIAERLRAVGYQTAAFGKWHVGSAPGLQPLDQGFDEFHGLLEGSRSYFALDDTAQRGRLIEGRTPIHEPDDLYVTEWTGARAARFIRSSARSRDPYFAYVSYTAPHTPMHALEHDLEWAASVLPADASAKRRAYVALTRALDRSIGALLVAIEETGEGDNTLVIFVNDNGGATDNGSDNGELRGMKGSKWEGGIRVPFAMRWRARIAPGTVFTSPVSTLDITATSLVAAGTEGVVPDDVDGVDLLPFLTGDATGRPHEMLFWRRGVAAAVRAGDWKLIRVRDNPTLLFNLSTDPGETTDVSIQHPDRAADLLKMLAGWEAGLAEPGWSEGEKWERNQLRKHRMDVIGRDAERKWP